MMPALIVEAKSPKPWLPDGVNDAVRMTAS